MNCQKFETVINDLARAQVMDATARQEALAHAARCANCDARFADEQVLTKALRRLAAEDADKQAPAHIEANLLAALRSQQAAANAVVAAGEAPSIVAKPARQFSAWWMAVAAMALIALAIAALRLQSAKMDKLPSQNAGQYEQQKMPDSPNSALENQRQAVAPHSIAPHTPNAEGQTGVESKPPKRRRTSTTRGDLYLAKNSGDSRHVSAPAASRKEIVTNFIPLTQGYSLPMSEGGQLVRVELPRSALSSFGLPVNSERLDEPVKADVVVGYDGIARAIRFVR